jgi:hypothetical protein
MQIGTASKLAAHLRVARADDLARRFEKETERTPSCRERRLGNAIEWLGLEFEP